MGNMHELFYYRKTANDDILNFSHFTFQGSVPFIFIMESIMEHVAKSLGKDPLEVRKLNLYQKGQVRGTFCSCLRSQ